VTIRSRRHADLPACVAVLAEVQRADGYPEIWPSEPAQWLDPPGTLAAWIAQPADRIAGHVSLIAAPDNCALLSRLFVAPTAQQQGLARQLMATALGWAGEGGLEVRLEVHAEAPAVALYERLGWRFLAFGQGSWIGLDGRRPTVRYYAAPS
jgi:GNAT superfamily N-acetyltransferase